MTEGARALIERAVGGVRVVVCPRCRGLGLIGLASMRADCPQCGGCGETTTNELEVTRNGDTA